MHTPPLSCCGSETGSGWMEPLSIRSDASPCASPCPFREMWGSTQTTGSFRGEKGMGGQEFKDWNLWCVIKDKDSRAGLPGFKSWLSHLLVY